MPYRRATACRMRLELGAQPVGLRSAGMAVDRIAVRVKDDDPPRPDVGGVPALSRRPGAGSPVVEVALGRGALVELVVAEGGQRAVLGGAPARVVAPGEVAVRAIRVGEVPGREHRARDGR